MTKAKQSKAKQSKAKQMDEFKAILLNKINESCVLQPVEIKVEILKQLYAMLMTPDGRAVLTTNDTFRSITEKKVNELINTPTVETKTQFLAMSRAVLMVIANIELGKNLY